MNQRSFICKASGKILFFYLLGMNKVPDMKRIRDIEARSGKLLLLTEVHCKPLYFILPLYTSMHMFKR